MKQSVNSYDFERAFKQIRPDNFSYKGLNALYEYLEGYEEDTGEEMELDVIAICCDFTEFEDMEEFKAYYDGYETIEELEEETTVIKIEDSESFITLNF